MVFLTFAVFAAGSASFLLAGQSDGLKQPPAIPPPAAASGEAQPNPANTTSEMRGDALMDRKNYQEAIATYLDAVRDQAILMNKIGIAYHQLMELDTAKRYYERALQINPNYSEAINNLGTIYYAKKDYGKAEREYKKALKLTPQSASIYSNLGTAYFARKRYDEAMQTYQKALSLDPEVFEHRSSAGVLLQERSVAERAKFHFYMAKTYAKAGVFDRALLYMRRALEEGFTERDRFRQDPEFAQMQEMPEFQQLLLLEPRVL